MKKNKLIIPVLLLSAIGLISCSGEDNNNTNSSLSTSVDVTSSLLTTSLDITTTTHTHTYANEWSYNDEYHFHKSSCEHADLVSDEEAHIFGNWETNTLTNKKKKTCSVCGYFVEEDIEKEYDKNGSLIKNESIYKGAYYDNITDEILNNEELLRKALNGLTNPANLNIGSYSSDTDKLKSIDTYDKDYVECIYTGMRIEKDSSGSTTGSWNKEHIWAKSYGFGSTSYDAYSDLNHLRVSEVGINETRANKYFGEVDNPTGTDDYGNSWTASIFEPRDEVKGDVARMMFYMVIKYENSLDVDLELTDDLREISQSSGQTGGVAHLGVLSTLLKWHFEDPVDEREITRNEAIYIVQKNRNPFIDHPEYAYYLFKDEAKDYISVDDLSTLCQSYITYDEDKISAAEKLVEAINNVTLDSEDEIKLALDAYENLDQESKSFYTKYRKLSEIVNEFEALKDAASRDDTIGFTLSFIGATSKDGTVSINGVLFTYESQGNNATYGIYSQKTKSIKIKASNLYSSIKSITLSYDKNIDETEPNVKITITDGTNKLEVTDTVSDTLITKTIDISSLDLTKEITITIENLKQKSVRLRSIEFSV